MTLVEFLAPLSSSSQRDKVLAVLYYSERYQEADQLTIGGIRKLLVRARVPKARTLNVADVLLKAGELVDTPGIMGKARTWKLTRQGQTRVRGLLGLPESEPEIEHEVGSLQAVIQRVSDPDVRDYLEDAMKCLRVGALRACVVFAWTGAIRTIQSKLVAGDLNRLNIALKKHYPRAKDVGSVDHFAYIDDHITLLAAQELGLLDKNEKDALVEALGLRNRSGHPGKYRPGAKKVAGMLEDLVSIVFA